MQAETDTVLGGDIAGWDHLPRLDLTARVVREALAPWSSSGLTSSTAALTSDPARPASSASPASAAIAPAAVSRPGR